MSLTTIESTNALDYESVTVSTVAVGLGKLTANGTPRQSVLLTAEGAEMRYRYDGGAPTSSEGHLLEVGDNVRLYGPVNLSQFRAIRTGGSDGTIKVTYHA